MQEIAEGQEMVAKPTLRPSGRGEGRAVHLVPFHDSISGLTPVPMATYPMAVQLAGDGHESAVRMVLVAPAGLGTSRAVHLVPSHDADRACSEGLAGFESSTLAPTATHVAGEVQATAVRKLPLERAGPGRGGAVHVGPVRASARG